MRTSYTLRTCAQYEYSFLRLVRVLRGRSSSVTC